MCMVLKIIFKDTPKCVLSPQNHEYFVLDVTSSSPSAPFQVVIFQPYAGSKDYHAMPFKNEYTVI